MNASFQVMLITSSYTPYRMSMWRALAKRVSSLDVVLLTEREGNRIWKIKHGEEYSYHVLPTKSFYAPWLDGFIYFGGRICQTIQEYRPTHVILAGYHNIPFITTIVFTRCFGLPLVQYYESHALSSRFSGGIIHWLRKMMMRQADAWIAPGLMTQEYLHQMGIPKENITVAPNVVNVSIFGSKKIPKRSGITRFLYVGRYVSYKGLDLLLDAFSRLPNRKATLRLVGHGPLEAQLMGRVETLGNAEMWPATSSPEETAKHYAWADVLLFPSLIEPWGLVINEALATGCYVISSSRAGVTPDLVLHAPLDVGRVIDPLEGVDTLNAAMLVVIDNIDHIRSQRDAIRHWGIQFTPERWANAVLNALKMASHEDDY